MGSKRTATAEAVGYRGHIVSENLDISCSHRHATQENARMCAKLALKYIRYRESLGENGHAGGWYATKDMADNDAHDIGREELLKGMEIGS